MEKLELSGIVCQDLASLNSNPAVSVEGVELIVKTACTRLSRAPKDDDEFIKSLEGQKAFNKVDSQKVSRLYSAISTLLLKAASEGNAEQVEKLLKESGWTEDQTEVVTSAFTSQKDNIRAVLKLYGRNPPKLIDVNWRLDKNLWSNTTGTGRGLLYLIELTLENDQGQRESLKFTADQAQLEDLVTSLRDACNSLRRVALSS